jgi:heme/copper-type cytochrome/quinol oxidase subunit 3
VTAAAHADRDAAAREVDSLVGMGIFLAAWAMLFAALFLAYAVVRVQAAEWPPFGAPRLPRAAPALSTFLLMASGVTLRRGLGRARRGEESLGAALRASILLGAAFLAAQVVLWAVMGARGLLPSSGVYGSVFFALTGFHALHVLGGLGALLWLAVRDRRGPRGTRGTLAAPLRAARLTALYWDFVAGVWLLMYLAIFWL